MLSIVNAVRRITTTFHKTENVQKVPERVFHIQDYLADPLKVVVIPLTTKKCYFYFKHTKEFLDTRSRLIRCEQKISEKATKTWRNMEESKNFFTQKIVLWVNMLLVRIAWIEKSLTSFPSESYILKRAQLTRNKKGAPNGVEVVEKPLTVQEVEATPDAVSKPVRVYYPQSVMSEEVISTELNKLWREGKRSHRRYFFYCLLGLPLTIPIALVPLIPNIPGFYLAYRAYCNYKAYTGARHLERLMEGRKIHQLDFVDLKEYSEIMSLSVRPEQTAPSAEEIMLLDENLLNELMESLKIHEIRRDLLIAIKQERQRLLCSSKFEKRKKKKADKKLAKQAAAAQAAQAAAAQAAATAEESSAEENR